MLSPYRVLDLTDEKGQMCGKMLADLGADVIKIEPPGGDGARKLGPFYQDEPDLEKSLFWMAYNTHKRGVTLNLETNQGKELLRCLVKTADFLVESFPPGYMQNLGLNYAELEKINPGLIFVSITPFGQTGPYREYKSGDLVLWGLGNHMYEFGDADRAPVRVSYDYQSYLNAGAEAAAAALIALYQRALTQEGQYIDLSIHECVTRLTMTADWDQNKMPPSKWSAEKINLAGNLSRRPYVWRCKDGHLVWWWWGGEMGPVRNKPLMDWMIEDGVPCDFIKGMDWLLFDYNYTDKETLDRIEAETLQFFMKHTKAEIYEGARKRRIMIYPISTVEDTLTSPQLAARNYWTQIEHPELGKSLTYPGSFTKATLKPPSTRRRAPLLGEHNREVYMNELGLTEKELIVLKEANII